MFKYNEEVLPPDTAVQMFMMYREYVARGTGTDVYCVLLITLYVVVLSTQTVFLFYLKTKL